MTTIGLSYSLVKRSTKCAPALVIERVTYDYREPILHACDRFSQEFRYWFFMHSQPTSGQPEGAISVIKTMSRNLKAIDW